MWRGVSECWWRTSVLFALLSTAIAWAADSSVFFSSPPLPSPPSVTHELVSAPPYSSPMTYTTQLLHAFNVTLSMFLVTGYTTHINRHCIVIPQESKCSPDRDWVWWEVNIKLVRRKIQDFKAIKEVHTNVFDVSSACAHEFRDKSSMPIVGSAGATPLRGGRLKTESE